MHIALFCQSLRSDRSRGNAHFLRGICRELMKRGHSVRVLAPHEPDADGPASYLANHVEASDPCRALTPDVATGDVGPADVAAGGVATPDADPTWDELSYAAETFEPGQHLDDVDLVIVNEATAPAVIARVGAHRAATRRYRLFLHDAHHRSVTQPAEIAQLDLRFYDGVLAFGESVRQRYLAFGWAERVWVWHEAADIDLFRPLPGIERTADVIWIGNWADGERAEDLHRFLLEPVQALDVSAHAFGAGHPLAVREDFDWFGVTYRGWAPHRCVPELFARARATLHIPRRPYVRDLPGVPTIRPFEALACGIPLISAPWEDREGLFRAGQDYLLAEDGDAVQRHLRDVLNDASLARTLAASGRERMLARHTCAHRVDELLAIHRQLAQPRATAASPPRDA